MSVRTRFAPSPTGYLHIGGVRTALFNWLFARSCGGQFILRIDDTDQQRNVDAALQPILDGFRWIGIDWDEGPEVGGPYAPYFQSKRSDSYQKAVLELLDRGLAYRDFAQPEEIQLEREAAEKEKREFVYSRKWMAVDDETAARFTAEGRVAVVRLKMPREGKCRFHDLVRGDVEFDWAKEQDHVIQRADGTCLYHLATVVDDHAFQISHVIRAIEHLSNTPRQIFIAEGLGYDAPKFAHIPYVAEPGGKNKISKRKIDKYLKNREFKKLNDQGEKIAELVGLKISPETFNPVLTEFYEAIGYLPDALSNYLLLLGWSLDDKTEEFTRQEMIDSFSLERIVKSPASFDPLKLMAFQDRYMQRFPLIEKTELCLDFLIRAKFVAADLDEGTKRYVSDIVQAAGDRIKIAGDILDYRSFFVPDAEMEFEEKAFTKRLAKAPDAAELLSKFRATLQTVVLFEPEPLERALKEFVEQQGVSIGQIIHALRVAITGTSVGFGMFETLAILGKDRCLNRIDIALNRL